MLSPSATFVLVLISKCGVILRAGRHVFIHLGYALTVHIWGRCSILQSDCALLKMQAIKETVSEAMKSLRWSSKEIFP